MKLFKRRPSPDPSAEALEPGLSPGSLIHIGERRTDASALQSICYNEEHYSLRENITIDDLPADLDPGQVHWLHFTGLHDVETLKSLGDRFEIDALMLEDILNTESRSKVEAYPGAVFVVAKALCHEPDQETIDIQHFAVLLLPGNIVLSFMEAPSVLFDPVLVRLSSGAGGRIRKNGADYLTWAILDSLVDHYLHALNRVEDKLTELDDRLQLSPEAVPAVTLYAAKRECSTLHRLMRPVVDLGTTFTTADTPLLTPVSKPFYRDLSDHTHQVRDALEAIREQAASLRDFHLAAVSHRMNEVMKVLTCFASIFLPLTFLAGIYGMNFDHIPELHWKWAYPTLWAIFLVMVGGMLWLFKRKKWL